MYGINHEGLTKKQTYEDLIEEVIGRKAKIKYPNREAKLLRESPTLINLLDGYGNGLPEMDEQHKRQVENTVNEVVNASSGIRPVQKKTLFTQTPIKKVVHGGNQTTNPTMIDNSTQAWRANIASGGTQTSNDAVMFDMTVDDSEFHEEVDDAIATFEIQKQRKRQQIQQTVERHLGTEVTQPILYLGAQQSTASSSSQPMPVDRTDAVKRNDTAEDTSRPVGRPRVKPLPADNTENTTPPKGRPKSKTIPMVVNNEGDSQKRQISRNFDSPGESRGKPKRKTKKEKQLEALEYMEEALPIQPGTYQEGGASSSTPSQPKTKTKKTITKEKPAHDTTKDLETNPKHWNKQNIAYIVDQLQQHHGVRFTKEQLKGKNKLKKGDLIDMIKEKINF